MIVNYEMTDSFKENLFKWCLLKKFDYTGFKCKRFTILTQWLLIVQIQLRKLHKYSNHSLQTKKTKNRCINIRFECFLLVFLRLCLYKWNSISKFYVILQTKMVLITGISRVGLSRGSHHPQLHQILNMWPLDLYLLIVIV